MNTALWSLRPLPYICQSCLRRRGIATHLSARAKHARLKRKGFTWKYGEKMEQADREWAQQASEIKAGEKESMLTLLQKRGYVHQIAGGNFEDLDHLMTEKPVGAYTGIDPTAPSLHFGHLLPLMVLLWLYVHGYPAITLLGGSTAQIGDPTGRTTSRAPWASRPQRVAHMTAMHLQIKKLWENMEKYAYVKHGYKREKTWRRGLVNNNAWWNKAPFLEVMKYLGSKVRVGTMLGRETARRGLKKIGKNGNNKGFSFAEFSYPLMQAWDWWELFKQRDVQIQIGGSDQYGNIMAGIAGVDEIVPKALVSAVEETKFGPLARRLGFTVPLLVTSSGKKFGKSQGNAIWLDPDMTKPFDQYAFLLKTSDVNVGRYLRWFTLIPEPEIEKLLLEHAENPSKRKAQHRLAYEVMYMVHGAIQADTVASEHNGIFSIRKLASAPGHPKKPVHAQDESDLNYRVNRNAPQINSATPIHHHVTLPRSLVENQPMARILYHAGLVNSRSEGARLMMAGGAYVGRQPGEGIIGKELRDQLEFIPVKKTDSEDSWSYVIDDSLLILRTGKWRVRIIRIVPDEEFDRAGLTAPGWKTAEERKGEAEYQDDADDPVQRRRSNEMLSRTQAEVNNRG